MRLVLALLLVTPAATLQAQDSCTCPQNLRTYISKVERNYAGYRDKVNDTTRPRYAALVDSLGRIAAAEPDRSRCFQLLEAYRAFFRDKHLQLSGAFAAAEGGPKSASPDSTAYTRASLDSLFRDPEHIPHPWEGFWQLEGYEVGLVHRDGPVWGVITRSENPNWKPGMVKFRIDVPSLEGTTRAQYWRGDLRLMETDAQLIDGHIVMDGIGTWRLTGPWEVQPVDERAFELEHGSEVQWRMLDDTTLYIKLGSCDLANKAVLDSLVAANASLLKRTPNWIVDLRGNGGGSTDVFQSLLPYLYTRPFTDHGADHWMSPENTALLKTWYEKKASMLDEGSARQIRKWIVHGEKRPNTWHHGSGGTTRYKKVKPMPRRVALLADSGTASSAEDLLMVARGMSNKCMILGGNSGGYMDYGDLQPHDLGCDGLVAAIPTSRMNRIDHGMRYDLEGIAPDVRVGDAEKDWIAVVRLNWQR